MTKCCSKCGQAYPTGYLENKRALKIERMKQARRDAKARGEAIGQPRKFDYNLIRQRIWNGYTRKEIMSELGCSSYVIISAIEEGKNAQKPIR